MESTVHAKFPNWALLHDYAALANFMIFKIIFHVFIASLMFLLFVFFSPQH